MKMNLDRLHEAIDAQMLVETNQQTVLPSFRTHLQNFKAQCEDNLVLNVTACLLVGLVILMILRPPFIFSVNVDTQRPWRNSTTISWLSVLVTLLILAAAVIFLPLLPWLHAP